MSICVGGNNSWGLIFCDRTENGLPKKIVALLQAGMVHLMFYCLLHTFMCLFGRAAKQHTAGFVYIPQEL